MAHRQKLRPDLILQSRYQFNPHERSVRKKAFDGIAKFGTRGLGVLRRAQLLIHTFASKIMRQGSRLIGGGVGDSVAQRGKVLPYRSMGEKLPHQCLAIWRSLRKEQCAG